MKLAWQLMSTFDWNAQMMDVKKGCLLAILNTLLSIIVHSTSSSSKTTSFFKAFMAYTWPELFNSDRRTYRNQRKNILTEKKMTPCQRSVRKKNKKRWMTRLQPKFLEVKKKK